MKAMQLKGAGVGLRTEHYQTILENRPDTPWFEVLTDNYMGAGGLPLHNLEKVCEYYPVSFHGVGLSLGSADPINKRYLYRLKQLAERFKPVQISDHLAWVSLNNHYAHELLPFPYSWEAVNIIGDKINQVQDYLGCPLLVENPSTYLAFNCSEMTEPEFIQALIEKTDCELLIDVNNIFISAKNHGFDANDYIRQIPAHKVKEIHLAGYEDRNTYLYDTHGYKIHDPVWNLYTDALLQFGEVPTLIEWDTDIPSFRVLQQEAEKAQKLINLHALEKSA
jgi:uncharacterized protein (UPF0276 family)